ncbi:unnamed protein product [Paramecium primaurelia]|uniref:Transmembrane protein n=1 Tax=Paramecium primaurelia TaxID=5886 RepID=A0A8S1QNU1_PARPR|nr:unnamed protein product [Paramecium primaurelia]
MVIISSLALLSDLLQFASYMKYMQYQFPPHLIEFLNTQTKVSLQPVMNYFRQINYLQNQMVVLLQIKSLKNRIKNLRKCFKWVLFGQCQKLLFFCHCIINNLFTLFSQCLKVFKISFLRFLIIKRIMLNTLNLQIFQKKKFRKKCLTLKIEYFFRNLQSLLSNFALPSVQ